MVNGQFLFEDLPVLVLKSFGALGLELGLEKRVRCKYLYTYTAQKMCGLYYYSKEKLGVKAERKQVLRKPVMTDRCLE